MAAAAYRRGEDSPTGSARGVATPSVTHFAIFGVKQRRKSRKVVFANPALVRRALPHSGIDYSPTTSCPTTHARRLSPEVGRWPRIATAAPVVPLPPDWRHSHRDARK